MSAPPPSLPVFTPTTPIETGITLLEASAGTGKTYQITNLVLRLVLESGLRLPEVLVVTFTHAATAELKERIRLRIGMAQRALEAGAAPPGDALLAQLVAAAAADTEHGRLLRARARKAREDLDQALISTIHGFCQRMLQLSAFESGTAFGRALVTDESEAVGRVVEDFLVTRLHSAPPDEARLLQGPCGWTRAGLTALARLALADPDLPLVPDRVAVDRDDWLARLGRFRQDWAAACAPGGPVATLTALVRDKKKAFDGRSYGARYAEDRVAQVDAWLASLSELPDPGEAWVRWFSPDQLAAKARSDAGTALATAPIFGDWFGLVSDAATLVTGARIEATRWLRAALARHHRRENAQTFHDLLRDLDRTLAHPARGPVLADAIRARFKAALIDEFQDTDALQWRIFGRVFGGVGAPEEDVSAHALYLIGDPKQAIYGFRGANVHVYLRARDAAPAHRRFTMKTNYRSDGDLVAAMNHLMDRPGTFGAGGIDYVRVDAHHTGARFHDPRPGAAPLTLVWADDQLTGEAAGELLGNGALQELLAERCAADVVALLASGATLGKPDRRRPVAPGDIAVLVRGHAQAGRVQAALDQRRVPAVIASQGSVFETHEATSLSRWLAALDGAASESSARLLAVDPLLGATVADLPGTETTETTETPGTTAPRDTAHQWGAWLELVGHWRRRARKRGVMAAFRALLRARPPWATRGESVQDAVLAAPGGERRMTNLLQLAELLHTQAVQARLPLPGLRRWLDRQRLEAVDAPEAAELRLEKDDAAVQIVTFHRSKGLQYPVVFVPFGWGDEGGRTAAPLIAPAPDDPAQRQLVLAAAGPAAEEAVAAQAAEARREGMRLLYVALTRAVHRCVLYWPGAPAPSKNGSPKPRALSAACALLHGGPPGPATGPGDTGDDRVVAAPARTAELGPADQRAELAALVAAAPRPGLLALVDATAPADHPWTAPPAPAPRLRARRLSRPRVDDDWRRHSYSAMTRADLAAQREEQVDPTRGLGFDDDRVASAPSPHSSLPPLDPAALAADEVPLAAFPAGADAGTCLHAVFEHLDFVRAVDPTDAGDHLRTVVARELTAHGFSDETTQDVLVKGIPAVLQTPLGPLLPSHCLADIDRADRLDELRFDFPIAGGDRGDGLPVTPQDLCDALSLRDPDDERVPRHWIERVAGLDFAPLRGFMTGSIDLVFRVPDSAGGRWFVVDHKSNKLDLDRAGRTVPACFDQARMRHEMAHHHYFLQYHLYTLALHRFLKLRLGPRYDYDRHMGGVLYLFVRGMTGPDAIQDDGVRGVFADQPPAAVIEALDEVFGAVEVPR